MLSEVKATIRRGRITGKMALTVTTHLTEIAASTNKYFVMHLYKGTEKVTRDMVGTTIVAETTMVDGVMAVGPGKSYLQSTLLKMPRPRWVAAFSCLDLAPFSQSPTNLN